MAEALRCGAGEEGCRFLPATGFATALLGDAIAANLFLLGYALQLGRLPIGLPALERAIELNGKAVPENLRALAWGRLAAHDLAAVQRAAGPALRGAEAAPVTRLDAIVARRVEYLTAYQSPAYARRYQELVERAATCQRERAPGCSGLPEAVARYYFKLLSYKDEYEVARLWTDGSFRQQLEREFESWERVELHLAPQIANPRDPDTGRARKWILGPWVFRGLALLAKLKFLRGTPLDPFGWTAHRRRERELIREYERTLEGLFSGLAPDSHEIAVEIARIPELIRGFDLVKDRHLEDAKQKEAELLAAFRLRATAAD
jgi:indolepyruvate ferredoxin oxidoreductase